MNPVVDTSPIASQLRKVMIRLHLRSRRQDRGECRRVA
jgi:hypothetical protein